MITYEGKEIKKIKDLPNAFGNLDKVKVKTFDGFEGWWVSQWAKGVWLRKEKGDPQVHPQFVEDLTEALEWEVIAIDEK